MKEIDRIVDRALDYLISRVSHKIMAKIVKKKDGYYVESEKGKNLGGPYTSYEKAKKRLRQVEYWKRQ